MLQLREDLADKRENHQIQVYQWRGSAARAASGFRKGENSMDAIEISWCERMKFVRSTREARQPLFFLCLQASAAGHSQRGRREKLHDEDDRRNEVDHRAADPHEGPGGDLVVEGAEAEGPRKSGVARIEQAAGKAEECGDCRC